MNYNLNCISLTYAEIAALQALLGYVQLHTSKELSAVSERLERLLDPDLVDYEKVKFTKLDKDHGSELKTYKNSNFAIKFVESK